MPLTIAVDLSAVEQRLTELQEETAKRLSEQVRYLTEATERRLEAIRKTLDEKVTAIQRDNAKQMQKIRKTLEERLDECFKRLERRQGFAHRRSISHRGISRVR